MAWLARIDVSKAFQLMLVGLLALVQLHFCAPTFRLPDGKTCATCLTLTDETPSNGLDSAEHGDCHDCCVLASCHPGEDEQADAVYPLVVFHFASFEQPFALWFPTYEEPQPQVVFEDSHPPTGPPLVRLGRAPPFSSMV